MTPGSQKKTAAFGSAVAIIGGLMILLPILNSAPKGSGAAPMIFIGMILAIVGGIIALVYRSRAKLISIITSPENILVKWDAEGEDIESTVISRQGFLTGSFLFPFKSKRRGGLLKMSVTQPVPGKPGKLRFLLEDVWRRASPTTEVIVYFPSRSAGEVNKAADKIKKLYPDVQGLPFKQ